MKLYLQLAQDAISGAPPTQYAANHREKLPFIIKVLNSAGFTEEAARADKALSLPLNAKELDITGQDIMSLGYRGSEIGEVLDYLLTAVHGGKIQNNFDDLSGYLRT